MRGGFESDDSRDAPKPKKESPAKAKRRARLEREGKAEKAEKAEKVDSRNGKKNLEKTGKNSASLSSRISSHADRSSGRNAFLDDSDADDPFGHPEEQEIFSDQIEDDPFGSLEDLMPHSTSKSKSKSASTILDEQDPLGDLMATTDPFGDSLKQASKHQAQKVGSNPFMISASKSSSKARSSSSKPNSKSSARSGSNPFGSPKHSGGSDSGRTASRRNQFIDEVDSVDSSDENPFF